VKIYNLGFDNQNLASTDQVSAARHWLLVLDRVYALGGLAVRRQDWNSVRMLLTGK
jgi:hypothetical protein